MNCSEFIVTEDVICELNLSPRAVPRLIGIVEKSCSSSSIGPFENHPVMDLGNEFNGKNNKSSLLRDCSEANTENGMKATDEKLVVSMGDCAKKTDSFSNDPKSVTHLLSSGSPEAIAGKDGITETLPRPRSSNRVLEMPPFNLSMEYNRSRDASRSLDDNYYRKSVGSSPHFSLEPFSHFSELNNNSLSELSFDELNDIFHPDGYFSLAEPTHNIKSSTLKSNNVSEEYNDHDLPKSLYHKNSTENPIEGFSILAEKTHISEISADGNIEKRSLSIVEAEGRSSFERSILDSENLNISYALSDGDMERSTVSIVKVEDRTSIENATLNTDNPDISYSSADGKMEKSTISIVNVEDRASIQRINSEKSYTSHTVPGENTENSTVNVAEKDGAFIEYYSLHTKKPYISYTLPDSTIGKSSVNIVEVAENETSLPDTITRVEGNQHEICYPIITEEVFEEPPLNIPSVTIVEMGNENNALSDDTKCNSATTVQPVEEIIYDIPVPIPRIRKSKEDLDESFVEWLQDHGFKVVDEGPASNTNNLEEKKKRLSWEFLFEDEVNKSDSNVDSGDRNIQTSSSNVFLTQNLKEKASGNEGAIQQICKEKSCQVAKTYPPDLLNNVYNDREFEVPLSSLDQDLENQFSSFKMHFEFTPTETESNTVLNQPKSDTNEGFIGNTLERITLPITNASEDSNKSTRLVDNRNLSEKYSDENGLIIENTYLPEEYSIPELITSETKLAFSQVSLVGPNTQGRIDLNDRPTVPEINGNRSQEGSHDLEDLDVEYKIKEGALKPSFILDAYKKESTFVESFDNSLISAAMDRYPEASWLTVESESAQECSSTSREDKVIESQTSTLRGVDCSIDLHTIPQDSKIELQSFVQNDFEPDSLNSSYSVSLVGRKTWTVNDGTKFDPYVDETEVCVVASVDTLKRKIEEARRSSYSSGSERSDEEMEESSVKFEDEDFVFFRPESGMHSVAEEIRDQNAVVPAPPPRPSLSSERLDKEPELSHSTTSYLETNLDLSSKSEGDDSSQKSPIPQQAIEHPQKIDPAKHEEDVPKSLINEGPNKQRESAVDVPEECVCTCPKKSTHSPRTECPQFPESSHNVIDTEPKSSASPQDDIQPAEPISSEESPTVGPDRATLQCPHCKATVVTATVKKPSLIYGCCILPLFLDRMKDVEHWCPECQCFIGKYSWKPFQKRE